MMTTLTAAAAMMLTGAQPQDVRPTIAILPAMNASGERWQELKDRQCAKVDSYLEKEFSSRGFTVIPKREVEASIAKLRFDFMDEEDHKKAHFYQVADEVKADYVFFPLITSTEQGYQDRDAYRDREGRCDVKVWFLKVSNRETILASRNFAGRSGGLRITLKPSDRQIQAAENAVRDSLEEGMKIYKRFAVK